MKWIDTDKALEQINLCRDQKRRQKHWWDAAFRYYEANLEDLRQDFDPTKLLSQSIETMGSENLVRLGIRVWQSVVLSAPYGVEVIESGSRMGDGIKKMAVQCLDKLNGILRQKPQHNRMFRDIATRSLIFNAGILYDEWCKYDYPYALPKTHVISHNDFWCDPASKDPINEPGGPEFVALRRWYYSDEIERLFGATVRKSLHTGSYYGEEKPGSIEAKILDDKYPIIEWWGIDRSKMEISAKTSKRRVKESFQGILAGQLPETFEWEDHRAALEEGDDLLMERAQEFGGDSFQRIDNMDDLSKEDKRATKLQVVPTLFLSNGLFGELDNYDAWRQTHIQYLQQGIEGGEKDKFEGYIYKVEFQENEADILTEPVASPYKHGQIPVSFFQRHEGMETFWTKGIMTDALTLQSEIEFLESNRNVTVTLNSRPPFLVDRTILPARYKAPDGMKLLAADIETGLKIIDLEGDASPNRSPILPQWAQLGAQPIDVITLIREKKQALMELFGASEIMRGLGPGSEASGKHIQLKMAAATRPSVFMLQLMEGPMHRYWERYTSNNLYLSDPKWLSELFKPEEVQAVMAAREMPDFHTIVKVQLGEGMPTDWNTRMQLYAMMMERGAIDPFMFMREMGIPIPEGAEEQYKAMQQMMAMAQSQGGPQGGTPQQGKMDSMGAASVAGQNFGSA